MLGCGEREGGGGFAMSGFVSLTSMPGPEVGG